MSNAAPVTERTAMRPASLPLQMWREWLAGLGLVRRHPLLRALFAVEAVRMLADGIVGASIVIFVTEVLGGDGQTLGWWVTANAIGGLVGGMVIGRFSARLRPSTFFGVALLLGGVLALLRTNVPVFGLALLLNGLIGASWSGGLVGQQTLLQASVADRFRGRVFGALDAMRALLMLIGAGIAGFLGDRLGVVAMFNLMSGLYVLAGALALALLPRASEARPAPLEFRAQPVYVRARPAYFRMRPVYR